MSQGTLTSTTLNLGNTRVILQAPNNNILDVEGNAGADVDVTGINDMTFSGEIRSNNGAFAISGHGFIIEGARFNAATSGTILPMGNGLLNQGPVMPASGTIVAISCSVETSSTGTLEAFINGSGTGLSTSLSASLSDFTIGGAIAFSAGDLVYLQVTSGTLDVPKGALFLKFD